MLTLIALALLLPVVLVVLNPAKTFAPGTVARVARSTPVYCAVVLALLLVVGVASANLAGALVIGLGLTAHLWFSRTSRRASAGGPSH